MPPVRFAGLLASILLVVATSCSSSGPGGAGGGGGGSEGAGSGNDSPLGPDGGFIRPPSYRPCLTNMECSALESCFPGTATAGICTRSCVGQSECAGDFCPTTKQPAACLKRCNGPAGCRGDLNCVAGVCENRPLQAPECKAYVDCSNITVGPMPSIEAVYGAMGTCWTTTQAAAEACTTGCKAGLAGLKVAYPDAGC